jgi:hypothetical protein
MNLNMLRIQFVGIMNLKTLRIQAALTKYLNTPWNHIMGMGAKGIGSDF